MKPAAGLDPNYPFTRARWVSAKLDPGLLRRSEFCQVIRSVWVKRAGIDDDTRIRAALALHPDEAVASHFSAARLLELPVPEHAFEHVTVFHPEHRRWRPEIKPHVTNRVRKVRVIRGIRCTDPVTTFIQLAGSLALVDLVVLGDALVKKYKVSPARLIKECRGSTDYYAGAALRAALYVRRGVDSPMETRLRMLLVLAGLPEPLVNTQDVNPDGTWRRRYDLCYPEYKLIVEYDGRQHAEDAAQWNEDLERREELDEDGFRIIVVTAKGVFVEPARTIARVRGALLQRGCCKADLVIDEGWREHFSC